MPYARASVFAWPSRRWEGFSGCPPVEAMQAGTPVVSSTADPMPEVLGDAAVYCDPDRPETLAEALGSILADSERRVILGEQGKRWAARYTVEAQGLGTAAAWKEALS